MANSFVENLNTIANATTAIAGDILADASNYRDEAAESAAEAEASAISALSSETLAKDWAEKGHNNPVQGEVGVDAEYSSYHWKEEARVLMEAGYLLDDDVTSLSYVWSSQFINDKLGLKSDISHTHAGTYEPVFTKNSAFNKNFGYTAEEVSTGYHLHDGNNGSVNYEPNIGAKGTAFNKDFGTSAGEAAEGNHLHTAIYEPKRSTEGTAYNKNFVVDTENPTDTEIPRGTHTHKASGISYDNTGNEIITSTTAQGALQNLDAVLGTIEIIEKTYGALSLDGASRVQTLSPLAWTKLDVQTQFVGDYRNMLSPSSGVLRYNYTSTTDNLIEGRFSGNIVVTFPTTSSVVSITPYLQQWDPILEEYGTAAPIDANMSIDITSAGTSIQSGTLAFDAYIDGMENLDQIMFYIKEDDGSTGSTSITIESVVVAVDGAPQGALVSTGVTVLHNDVTGRDAVDQHPVGSITGLQTALDGKAALAGSASQVFDVADGIVGTDAVNYSQLDTKIDKVGTPTTGAIPVLDVNGELTDSTILPADKAEVAGSTTQLFSVQDGTTGNEAVNYGQLDTVNTNADSKIPKVSTPTTGNFPQLATDGTLVDSIYDETSFSASGHGHAISDVTDLQTTLDGKYDEVGSAVTDNLPTFAAGDALQDSGTSIADIEANALAFSIALG